MAEPTLRILGVYRPVITNDVFDEQKELCGSEKAAKEHFAHLVLIEAIVDAVDERFQMSDFRQVTTAGGEQVAYDEALLSSDGESVLERYMDCVKGTPPLRCTFYLHCFDEKQSLLWTYGSWKPTPL